MRDTIFALATPPGRSAIAVLRASGPVSGAALVALAGRLPPPRLASVRKLRDPRSGAVFDEGLVLWFAKPGSFTGEDAFELHLHGGAATVAGAASALVGLGLRPAEPGEFSRRAFETGRLSLTEAEAIADLVDAETEAQRRQALDQLGGALDRRHARWRETLVRISALLEVRVDFPDEDLPETFDEVEGLITGLVAELGEGEWERRGVQVREGFRIALIGLPNAGKSSLLNALIRRDAAIVTPVPGTTRDIIEASLTVGSYKVLLADTAGLRESADPIEAEGVRRARAWSQLADLRLLVIDGASADRSGWAEELRRLSPSDAVLLSKADLAPRIAAEDIRSAGFSGMVLATTVASPEGAAPLWAWLEQTLADRLGGADFPSVTRERHRRRINAARGALSAALDSLSLGAELAAEDVRRATKALRSVSGDVSVEEVLGEVFSTFCIGK